jgi:integrase
VRRDLHVAVKRANACDANPILRCRCSRGTNGCIDQHIEPPIPKVSPNDLRRTFASWLIQNGADRFTVATLMGHTSTRMIEKVYGKLKQENLDMAIAVMPRLPGWTE